MSEFIFEDKKVYYETYGEGQPILLLNGIMMSTASWEAFKSSFSAYNKLILVDFLDQGKSERLKFSYTLCLQVKMLKALLEHIGENSVNIVGISYGSSIALNFALSYPVCVKRLVIFNGAARTSKWLTEIGWAWKEALKLPDGKGFYYTTIPPIYSTRFYDEHYDWMKKRAQKLIPYFGTTHVKESLRRLTTSSEGYDIADKLCDIKCKTLIVSATEDMLIPQVEQEILQANIPNSQMVIIPHCGHASMYEVPMLFAALCLGWINVPEEDFSSILR